MNPHAGWGRDGRCTWCGTDDPGTPTCVGPVPETNATAERRERRKRELFCSYCPPNQVENASRKAKHGHNKRNKRKK